MKPSSKRPKAHTRQTEGGPKDRKSGTGITGSPKKGGHGGKFTWSGNAHLEAEIEFQAQTAVDAKDPNFEDPEEGEDIATV